MSDSDDEKRIKQIMRERGVGRLTAEQMLEAEEGGDLQAVNEDGTSEEEKGQPIDQVKHE